MPTEHFPLCAFDAPYRKETTLSFTMGLAPSLLPLNALFCSHKKHLKPAGGVKSSGVWNSAAAAAYPTALNFTLARSLVSCVLSPLEAPLARQVLRAP